MKKFKCQCAPDIEIQEYRGQVCVEVPDFIELKMNNPERSIRKKISLDVCLVAEVFFLWKKGIKTTGCCCGHNKYFSYIGVEEEFIPLMKSLGYEVCPNQNDLTREDSFYPKTLSPN